MVETASFMDVCNKLKLPRFSKFNRILSARFAIIFGIFAFRKAVRERDGK